MDPTFLIGFIGAFGVVIFGIIFGGSDIGSFIDIASVLIVLFGTLFAVVGSFPLSTLKHIPKHILIVIKGNLPEPTEFIGKIVECAQIARKDGLLALESHATEQEDPFLKSSLLLIIDAVDADKVRSVLENDLLNMETRHNQAVAIYERGAAYAPAFGMIGTLIGLIGMLANLDMNSAEGVSNLTGGMATALVTTFYGSLLANIFFTPIASKLQVRHERELVCKEIIIEGILAIQAGENPKFIQEKLLAFLSTKSRQDLGDNDGQGGSDDGGKKKKAKKPKKEK